MAKNHLKLGYPLFARFLMCTSIIFFWVAAQGPKSSFYNPKLGARFKKKHGFEGSQVVYRCTHSEEGGPGIHPGGVPYVQRGGGYPMYIGRGVPYVHRGGGTLCTLLGQKS